MSYTKGPWKADGLLSFMCGDQDYPFTTVMHRNQCVCAVNGEDSKPMYENARLIAAAPELLQACKKVAQWLDYPGFGKPLKAAGIATIEACLEKLRAAIARATGSEL